mmetsp:Transcript_149396/g.260951  ORF Transcript_149396/g.260951 Transcript_149396/m.260951 type:complete len:204 (-) Transcript_149396:62-673(-)
MADSALASLVPTSSATSKKYAISMTPSHGSPKMNQLTRKSTYGGGGDPASTPRGSGTPMANQAMMGWVGFEDTRTGEGAIKTLSSSFTHRKPEIRSDKHVEDQAGAAALPPGATLRERRLTKFNSDAAFQKPATPSSTSSRPSHKVQDDKSQPHVGESFSGGHSDSTMSLSFGPLAARSESSLTQSFGLGGGAAAMASALHNR